MKTLPLMKLPFDYNAAKVEEYAAKLMGLVDLPFKGIVYTDVQDPERPRIGAIAEINVSDEITPKQEAEFNLVRTAFFLGVDFVRK